MLIRAKISYFIAPAIFVQILHSVFGMITYDEVHFLSIATSNSGLFDRFALENFEGFGMIFWFLYIIIIRTIIFITQDYDKFTFINEGFDNTRFFDYTNFLDTPHLAIILMRGFALGSLMLLIVKFLLYIRELSAGKELFVVKYWNMGILLALMTSPLFMWSGKIASPELFATSFCGIAALYTLEKKPPKAIFWMTLALSFKISALPVVIGLLIVILIEPLQEDPRKKERQLLVSKGFEYFKKIAVIFVILNPIVIYNTTSFLSNLPIKNSTIGKFEGFDWKSEIKTLLYVNYQTWDLVSISGFLYWGSVFLLPLCLVSWLLQRHFRVRFLFLIISSLVLLTGGVSHYPWYQFPLVCALFVFATLNPSKMKLKHEISIKIGNYATSILVLLLIFGCVSNGYREIEISRNWNKDRISVSSFNCKVNGSLDPRPIDLGLISKSVASETTSFYEANASLDKSFEGNDQRINLILGAVSASKYLAMSELNGYRVVKEAPLCGSIKIYELERIGQ